MSLARDIANLGSSATRTAGSNNKNMIINGSMNVAQRATSATGIGGSNGYHVCDRWSIGSSTTAGRLTMTQESDGPSGFANSTKLACTTADTSIAGAESMIFRQLIEGQDLQRICKGTSDAKEITFSFYAKANAAATYTVELFDATNSRQISKTFSVTTAWTRVSLTFPADTTGAFADSNAVGLYVMIWLHVGGDVSSGTVNDTSWAASVEANRVSSSQTSFLDSTARTFFITGVQLEVGSTATDFEHEPYSVTLAKAQRYYFQETTTATDASGILGVASGAATVVFNQSLPVQMRTKPSVSLTSTNLRIGDTVAAGFTTTSGTIAIQSYSGSASVTYTLGGFSGLTSYRTYLHEPDGTSTGYVKFDAEL